MNLFNNNGNNKKYFPLILGILIILPIIVNNSPSTNDNMPFNSLGTGNVFNEKAVSRRNNFNEIMAPSFKTSVEQNPTNQMLQNSPILISKKQAKTLIKTRSNSLASINVDTSITINASDFVSIWDPFFGSSVTNSITLPLISTGTYNFTVYWGDGTNDSITSYNQIETTHVYTTVGQYEVVISGKLQGWAFTNNENANKILEIKQWGAINLGNGGGYFYNAQELTITATDSPDLNGTNTMNFAFAYCYSLGNTTDLNNWDVSNVTNMRSMFERDYNFNGSLNNWNTSSVKIMSSMFDFTYSFNQPIGNWNTSQVTNMDGMFAGSGFNQPINNWDVSHVQTMGSMFNSDRSFNQSLNTWNVSSVMSMGAMFDGAFAFNQSLNTWNVSSVMSMGAMFDGANAFNQPINNWSTPSLRDVSYMFFHAPSFNQPIDHWNTSSVTTMAFMFFNATSFNQPIDNWDTSSVRIMTYMFFNATSFNQPIGHWDTSSVTFMDYMFMDASSFNQSIDHWDTSSVIRMQYMFANAIAFNQPLGSWDVSGTDLSDTFANATAFNQPLGTWDVSNAVSIGNLFIGDNLSYENYDNLLIGWSKLDLTHNIRFNAGNSKYSSNGASAKKFIVDNYHWIISDGGQIQELSSPIVTNTGSVTNSNSLGSATSKSPGIANSSWINELTAQELPFISICLVIAFIGYLFRKKWFSK